MIAYFVFQDADQPALFCRAARESLAALERREEGFLHRILRLRRVSQTHECIFEQVIAIQFHPSFRVGQSAGSTRRGARLDRLVRDWIALRFHNLRFNLLACAARAPAIVLALWS